MEIKSPPPVLRLLRKVKMLLDMNKEWSYQKSMIKKHSHSFVSNKETELATLLITSHVIEKGITMPDRHMGFGYATVRDVIERCNRIISAWGAKHTELQAALADLRQYLEIHKEAGFSLPKDISEGIRLLLKHQETTGANCYNELSSDYFNSDINFPAFAKSRHSIRSFSGIAVDDKDLEAAIELAMTAPSACNRQATRVRIIRTDEKKRFLSSLQRGNRGFGDKADKWLLITSELGCWPHLNTSDPYLDAGIFTMNLLYALHYHKIAACTLNANLSPKEKARLQKVIGYPTSEIPIVFIAVGKPKEEFMIARSCRHKPYEIIHYY